MVKLLEKNDESTLKEILKVICSISNSERGKQLLMQCNVTVYITRMLKNCLDPDIVKSSVACLSNIATCDKYKRVVAENHCLIHVLQTFQHSLTKGNGDLAKFCLYFFGNVCEGYAEASYVLGQLLVMKFFATLFNGHWEDEVLLAALDALHTLLAVKSNVYYSVYVYRKHAVQAEIPSALLYLFKSANGSKQCVKVLEVFEVLITQR